MRCSPSLPVAAELVVAHRSTIVGGRIFVTTVRSIFPLFSQNSCQIMQTKQMRKSRKGKQVLSNRNRKKRIKQLHFINVARQVKGITFVSFHEWRAGARAEVDDHDVATSRANHVQETQGCPSAVL